MVNNSRYRIMRAASEDYKNLGYNYTENGMLPRFISPRIIFNETMSEFVSEIDKIMIETTESVKLLQNYTNYTVDKNERRYNS